MTRPTYTQQFNKITEAYIRGEIHPLKAKFCVCGNLCDNNTAWYNYNFKHNDFGCYSGKDYRRIEIALLLKFSSSSLNMDEEELFNGMVASLEVLKQIHIEGGEVIDDAPVFTKRELLTTPGK